jgi:RNA polymerase sigma factor (sigma-70 family)
VGNLAGARIDDMAQELSEDMRSALSGLTARQQECVLLKFVEHRTEAEIAAILSISQPAVSKHLSVAVIAMRKALTSF